MATDQPDERRSAADTVARPISSSTMRRTPRRRGTRFVETFCVLALFGVASNASAQSNGPAYAGTGGTPESGANCSVSPAITTFQGPGVSTETVTCTTVSQSATIYFGIRNDQVVIGDKEIRSEEHTS